MKIAVVGGAGVRTPLLVNGLGRSDLPITEIALYDIDHPRLAVIGGLARRLAGNAHVRLCYNLSECLEGADFVFISIRVGGIEGRARDEAVTLAHGIVGQETVGPGGFAMAMRTIPEVVRYVFAVERHAPQAWIVNFTNPVGIVTQAIRATSRVRVVGICDTPTELFAQVAHVLGLPMAECYFDYVGLNHLGWLRQVYHRSRPQLDGLWHRPDLLAKIYRAPLFEVERLQRLRLLPTEYAYYYYRPELALENVKRAGRSRGEAVAALNRQLFDALRREERDALAVYEEYLAARSAGYMQIESGAAAPPGPSPWADVTGYARIALDTVRGIHLSTNVVIPLNVVNNGNIPDLQPDDEIEAPCMVNSNGPLPLHVGAAPDAARDLLVRVKAYERATVRAALSGERAHAVAALTLNPLVDSPGRAALLVSALLDAPSSV
jgi:6-phospho-beta-glucosidase